jgi:predicted ribosomally synthesized peptide with nif11-like leader
MNVSQLEQFRKAINADAKLQEQIKGGIDLVELAKANGFSLTTKEIQAGLASLDNEDADLSDFELEMISGGGLPGDNKYNGDLV